MQKEYKFNVADLDSQLPVLLKNGVTELTIHDNAVASDKNKLMKLIKLLAAKAPDLFVSIYADAAVIDREVVMAASGIFCSFDIPLKVSSKGGKILFDKKFYANKAKLLNDFGLVFGFILYYAETPSDGDTLKQFMDRIDFAANQYPNHLEFPQTEDAEIEANVTGIFSAKDIRYARDLAFACKTFYSCGRAVPWFNSVLYPLRIYPSRFFADFAEWQRCNNCDFKSGFNPDAEKHDSIEKMQLLFLEQKFEEKNKRELYTLVQDIVKVNGAMSRLAGENIESTVETSYHPDDLFGPESMDLEAFCENVCMEHCEVRIFAGEEGPEYSV
ncbi:MAG: hypothetical protein MJ160_05480 [Treponema sp.]|nr:hypothetical protein [Treponema sp.]